MSQTIQEKKLPTNIPEKGRSKKVNKMKAEFNST
jgi:hypothetical protein